MRTWIKLAPAVLLLLPFTPPASGADDTTAQKIEKDGWPAVIGRRLFPMDAHPQNRVR